MYNDVTTDYGPNTLARMCTLRPHCDFETLSHAQVVFGSNSQVAPSLDTHPTSSVPHNGISHCIARHIAFLVQHAYIVLRDKDRTATHLSACTQHIASTLTTNNGHPTEGKTKGLDSSTAASRVLRECSRRRNHGAPIVLLELAREEDNKVTKDPQDGGGDC
jgi:hypothetical protein